LTGGHSEHGGDLLQFTIPAKFRPLKDTVDKITKANADAKTAQTTDKNAATRAAYITAARDRIKVAANIQPRPYNELREEERIVIYRRLLSSLMDVGVDVASDPHVLHKVSELLTAMFDVDQMLYFVAPEWWRPRMHASRQTLAPELADSPPAAPTDPWENVFWEGGNLTVRRKPSELDDHVVGWGGVDESGRDNYYITEDSAVARMGSSLGWLLQLDGDSLRNAFLNAPWVKAVMPIRQGKELDALNWLTRAQVEGNDGLCESYTASSWDESDIILGHLKEFPWHDNDTDDFCSSEHERLVDRYRRIQSTELTVLDALRYVAIKIKEKTVQGQEKITEILDNGISLSYLPADRVYEYGFDPLQGGFVAEPDPTDPHPHYKVFDQWIEVMPTDQVVAVEVEYDPATGQMIQQVAEK
jgi:hypothetical protein